MLHLPAWDSENSSFEKRVSNDFVQSNTNGILCGAHRRSILSQRGGYGGYYIPEANFSLHFGAEHWFRIQSQPSIVDGYPRFQYGGYSFMIVDPWPAAWAENWYAADDVYVGYDNGYYLYNRAYPGEAIAITVVL